MILCCHWQHKKNEIFPHALRAHRITLPGIGVMEGCFFIRFSKWNCPSKYFSEISSNLHNTGSVLVFYPSGELFHTERNTEFLTSQYFVKPASVLSSNISWKPNNSLQSLLILHSCYFLTFQKTPFSQYFLFHLPLCRNTQTKAALFHKKGM